MNDQPETFEALAQAVRILRREIEDLTRKLATAETRAENAERERRIFREAMLDAYRAPAAKHD